MIQINKTLLLSFLFLLMLAACSTDPASTSAPAQPADATPAQIAQPTPTPTRTPDPTEAILDANQWLLITVVHRGNVREIDLLYPTYFRFNLEDGFVVFFVPCTGTDTGDKGHTYTIEFQGNQTYTLKPGDGIDVGCGGGVEWQLSAVKLDRTYRYELEGEMLLLIGEETVIVLQNAGPAPPPFGTGAG